MITTSILLVTLALVACVTYHLRRLKLYSAASKIPGPRAWPIIGNAQIFLGGTEKALERMTDIMNNYPSPMKVWLGNRLVIGVDDPEQIKTIFNHPKAVEKDTFHRFFEPLVGEGLLTAPASKWRKNRRIIEPSFNQRILDTFIPVFDKQSQILAQRLKSLIGVGEFEVQKYISLCTLDMLCETAMGVSINAQFDDENCLFLNYVHKLFEVAYLRVLNLWLHPDFIYNRTKYKKIQDEGVGYIHNFTDEVIQNKKLQLKEPIEEDKATLTKAFLDHLMEVNQKGKKLTDIELRDEAVTFMMTGYNSTATTNTFLLYMLAIHPDIQDKVYEEISYIYSRKSSKQEALTSEDLSELEYLERVIKETLRMFAAVPILSRQAEEDLELDGKILPKGCAIVIAPVKTHRDEKYWPNPLKFDPDRFLPEEVAKRHPCCYLPFSGGPRTCPGLKYAMMSMKVLIANVLKEYVIEKDEPTTIEDIKLKLDVVLKSTRPLKIKIEQRVA